MDSCSFADLYATTLGGIGEACLDCHVEERVLSEALLLSQVFGGETEVLGKKVAASCYKDQYVGRLLLCAQQTSLDEKSLPSWRRAAFLLLEVATVSQGESIEIEAGYQQKVEAFVGGKDNDPSLRGAAMAFLGALRGVGRSVSDAIYDRAVEDLSSPDADEDLRFGAARFYAQACAGKDVLDRSSSLACGKLEAAAHQVLAAASASSQRVEREIRAALIEKDGLRKERRTCAHVFGGMAPSLG